MIPTTADAVAASVACAAAVGLPTENPGHWLEPAPRRVSPAAFGVLLRDLHAALASYEADLPLLVGPLTDITTALATQVDPVLHESAERLLPLALTWPLAAILADDIQDAGLYDEGAAELRRRLP